MTEFEIPECAVTAFERIHKLNVTVHDLTGTWAAFLKPYRFHHRSPLCLAVKAHGHQKACVHFDVESLQRDLNQLTAGRIHVCHAGLVEWVVPVFEQKTPSWILFAGPRRPGTQLASALRSQPTRGLKSFWATRPEPPALIEEDEAQLIMEHLRQLAARLQNWVHEFKSDWSAKGKASGFPAHSLITRETAVRQFIENHYAQPVTLSMLAKRLCLSEGRASHVVRQLCGTTFRELLIQKRLSAAMEMLRHSSLSVLEVALISGFEDVAHFHRLFRRRTATTPARYRLSEQS